MVIRKVQLVKLAPIRASRKTLAVCLDLENESTVVNELFYQFVLNQESDKRRMIMAVYQMNVRGVCQ